MTNLLLTYVIAAASLLAVLAICHTEDGAGPRYMQARRYHRAGLARHTVRAVEPAPMPAPATAPDIAPFVRTT